MSQHNKLVIIDQMMSQLDAARPGIVPGSVCQSILTGIETTPTSIRQHDIQGNGGSAYTTFPLSPIIKNCNLDQTYLNLEFDINLRLTITPSATEATATNKLIIPVYFGFRDTASIFNQIQILEENAAIWTTVYQREEATLAYCSLPETEIRGNNQYSSVEKMRRGRRSPMQRVLFEYTGALTSGTAVNIDKQIHFKLTVDLNRLTPLISNLHWTSPHFGNLRLKVFMQEIQKALFFCPDYNFYAPIILDTTNTYNDDKVNAALFEPMQNAYYQFYPLNEFVNTDIASTKIPFYAYRKYVNATTANEKYIGHQLLTYVKFTGNTNDFFTFQSGNAEIVQKCFDIEEAEYQRLTDYFASVGSIIIPSQTWSTMPFNGGSFGGGKGDKLNTSYVGNLSGYNIDFISVFVNPNSSPCCVCPEFYKNVQLLLEGRPINALRYEFINDKAIVDFTQAIIDTDHEEINADYMDSLNFMNLTGDANYIDQKPNNIYGTGSMTQSTLCSYVSNPNLYVMNFSTNLPDAFHTGAATLEKSTRNALIKLECGSALDDNANFDYGSGTKMCDLFPYVINHKNTQCVFKFSALCDVCIVLDYDAARGTCYNGSMSWAAPYN